MEMRQGLTLTVAVLNVISERGVSTELLRFSRLLSSLILASPLLAKAYKIIDLINIQTQKQ